MTTLLSGLNHLHEVLHLGDHATHLPCVGNLLHAADTVQPEPDQGLALGVMTTDRAADLLDLDALAHAGLTLCLAHHLFRKPVPTSRDDALIRGLLRLAGIATARLQRRHLD